MVSKASRDELLSLSAAERFQLAQDLWDSVVDQPESLELSDAQKAMLDERLSAFHASPNEGSTWNEVRDRIVRSE